MEGYDTRNIGHDGAFIALSSLHFATRLDDLTECFWLDFHGCYTSSLCLVRCEDDFIRIHTMVVRMSVVVRIVAMTFVSMGIVIMTFMSVGIVVVCFRLGFMFVSIMIMTFV